MLQKLNYAKPITQALLKTFQSNQSIELKACTAVTTDRLKWMSLLYDRQYYRGLRVTNDEEFEIYANHSNGLLQSTFIQRESKSGPSDEYERLSDRPYPITSLSNKRIYYFDYKDKDVALGFRKAEKSPNENFLGKLKLSSSREILKSKLLI